MLSKTSQILFLLTTKIFKDNENLLTKVTFRYKLLYGSSSSIGQSAIALIVISILVSFCPLSNFSVTNLLLLSLKILIGKYSVQKQTTFLPGLPFRMRHVKKWPGFLRRRMALCSLKRMPVLVEYHVIDFRQIHWLRGKIPLICCLEQNRGTQREYSSTIALLNIFQYLNGRYRHIFIP